MTKDEIYECARKSDIILIDFEKFDSAEDLYNKFGEEFDFDKEENMDEEKFQSLLSCQINVYKFNTDWIYAHNWCYE